MNPKSFFESWNSFNRRLTKHFNPRQKKLWGIFVFLAKFAILSLPLHFLLWVNFDATPVQEFVAKAVNSMLEASGIAAKQAGTFIAVATKTGPLTVEIIKDCVGWKSILALFGLIFATPKIAMRKRIVGLLAGAPAIFILNLFRIWSTVYITVLKGYDFWEITHTFLWQEGLIIAVVAVWLAWMKLYARCR